MASVNWKKIKGSAEAKAIMRHDEKEQRQQTGKHSNPDIDRDRTHLNFSVMGRSYADRCKMYDDAIAAAAAHSKRKLRGDAVTCIGLCTTMPDGLTDEQAHDWFTRVHDIMVDTFGEDNVIDTDVHMDEIHNYYDPDKDKVVTSRPHAHTAVIPRTADGRLCAEEISSRSAMIALNAAIEDMTQREYGVQFMTGEGKKGRSVEQLKADSFIAAQDEERRAIEHRHDLIEKNKDLHKRNEKLQAINDNYARTAKRVRREALADRAAAKQEREAAERDRAAAKAAAAQEQAALQQQLQAQITRLQQHDTFGDWVKERKPDLYTQYCYDQNKRLGVSQMRHSKDAAYVTFAHDRRLADDLTAAQSALDQSDDQKHNGGHGGYGD